MFRLMIKTHTVTGLKYLCISQKDDYESYMGSGTYWQRHLKKHGRYFQTTVLFEHPNRDEVFIERCLYYSELYDVVNNPDFANLIPEDGNSSFMFGKNRTELMNEEEKKQRSESMKRFWATPEGRDKMKKRMDDFWASDESNDARKQQSLRLTKFYQSEDGDIEKENMRERMTNFWASEEGRITQEGRLEKLRVFYESDEGNLAKEFMSDYMTNFWASEEGALSKEKISEKLKDFWASEEGEVMKQKFRERVFSDETRLQISKRLKMFWDNLDEDLRTEQIAARVKGRLAMSDEAKKLRAEKVRESYKTSDARKAFEESMKTSRLGGNNPAAKPVQIEGVRYESFSEAARSLCLAGHILSRRVNSTSDKWFNWKRV